MLMSAINQKSAGEFAAKERKEHKERHCRHRTIHSTGQQISRPKRTAFGSLFAFLAPFRGSPKVLSRNNQRSSGRSGFHLLTALCAAGLILLGGRGTASATEDFQSWHGFNWKVWQTNEVTASLYGEVRFRENASQLYQSLLSPRLVWHAHPNVDLGLNYTWFANRTGTGLFADTHRLETEVNPHFKLADWLEFHSRNRLEIYWLDGVQNERYRSRNRLQLTAPLTGLGPLESVYCNNEFWYEFYRMDYTLNRAVPLGLNFHVAGRTHLAVFYMIQSSKQTTGHWDQAHILGTTVSF
ncbi:MAG: DUF2490 domain-containing protein [Proteobacteria bacterium]|nr:DUF2490 domain-containing protein [Pseudomonadota bacterium]